MESPISFDVSRYLQSYRRHLPHWRFHSGIYFVTWRLGRDQPPLTVLERDQVAKVLRFLAGRRYDLFAFVVMNDHVHVLVRPYAGFPLEQVMHSWKSYSAHLLRSGRNTPVWQREYFDRLVRDEAEFDQKVHYILGNPSNRWPGVIDYPWVWCRPDLLD